jgi:hypothetical protein
MIHPKRFGIVATLTLMFLAACGSSHIAQSPMSPLSTDSPAPLDTPTSSLPGDLPAGTAKVQVSGPMSGTLQSPVVTCEAAASAFGVANEIDVNGTISGHPYVATAIVDQLLAGTTSATVPAGSNTNRIHPQLLFAAINYGDTPQWGPPGTATVTLSNGGKSGSARALLVETSRPSIWSPLVLVAFWTCP